MRNPWTEPAGEAGGQEPRGGRGLSVALGRSRVGAGHGKSRGYDFMKQRCEQSVTSREELEGTAGLRRDG